MDYLSAILLGIIQGLTEFLPVSSSGHLTILQHFLGVNENSLIFDIFLHGATLIAVIICYRKDIAAILAHPWQKYTALIIVACIPPGIAGVFFDDAISVLFNSVWIPVLCLIITAILMFICDKFIGNKNGADLSFATAFLIGVFQMFALLPGISRSGATIFAALLVGLSRTEAAKFSFIVSIPVVAGAFLMETLDVFAETGSFPFGKDYLLGGVFAVAAGIFAIKLVVNLVNKGKMAYFGIYCLGISLVTAILLLLGF